MQFRQYLQAMLNADDLNSCTDFATQKTPTFHSVLSISSSDSIDTYRLQTDRQIDSCQSYNNPLKFTIDFCTII